MTTEAKAQQALQAAKAPKTSQVAFYKGCEAIKAFREEISQKCKNRIDVAAFLAEKVGEYVAPSSVSTMLEAIGLTMRDLLPGLARTPKTNGSSTQDLRNITRAILTLFRAVSSYGIPDLDKEPAYLAMIELYARKTGKPVSTDLYIGYPVKNVPPSKTLPVVGAK